MIKCYGVVTEMSFPFCPNIQTGHYIKSINDWCNRPLTNTLALVRSRGVKLSYAPLTLRCVAGNHLEIVQMILEHKPNVNALDKDGYTALAIACKEGYYDIAVALINTGAYINVQVSR